MPQIQIGSLVLAKGEQLLRRVLAIKDDHARVLDLKSGMSRWLPLKQLVLEGPIGQLKTHLL